MKIKSVHLKNFTVHEDHKLELQDTGICLITGSNGAGKSSFIDGISYALYGRTLRGTNPWRGTDAASVEVQTDKLSAKRSRVHAQNKDRQTLTWQRNGEEVVAFETTTKAQEALESELLPFEVWRRTSVLSSADASTFTLAADSERKRLMETILGLDRFDRALDAAKADLKLVEQEYQAEAYAQERARVQRVEIEQRIHNAKEAFAACPAEVKIPEGVEARILQLSKLASEAMTDLRKAQEAQRKNTSRMGELKSKYMEAERRAKNIAVDACPTCNQSIPQTLKEKLDKEMEALKQEIINERATIAGLDAASTGEIHELEDEARRLEEQKRNLSEKVRAAEQSAALRNKLAKQLKDAEADLNKVLAVPAPDLTAVKIKVATQRAVVDVLGTKGFRAHVLGTALNGISAAANEWLHRISNGKLSLTLQAYTEKSSGGVSDSISIKIMGAGGDRGSYQGCSGGERRRVDVALLMGLAEVAQAATGVQGGTVILDEAADALDTEGVSALCAAINDMSQLRSVVVITHNPEIVKQLHATQRITL